MKIMLRAAMGAWSIASIGSAHAAMQSVQPSTLFSQKPGVVVQALARPAPDVAFAQDGQVMKAYVTRSQTGTWLFQNNRQTQGANS
jgi:hypothetical protein